MPESPRFGDLVRVTSTGIRGTQWQSTVDEHGNYDGKDLVEAGAATMRVIKRYESPLMARHPSQETIPSPWPNPAAEWRP